MKPRIIAILIAIGFIVFSGIIIRFAGDIGKPVQIETNDGLGVLEPAPHQPRIIEFLVDGTKSYMYFDEAKQFMLRTAASVGRHDVIYVTIIGPWATEKKDLRVTPNLELLKTLREIPKEAMYVPELREYRLDYINQIKAMKFENLVNTDVYGAISYASKILQDDKLGREKYLIIFSDFGDTVDRKDVRDSISLTGINVSCLYFPTNLINREKSGYKPNLEQCRDQFLGWGAAEVLVAHHAQSGEADPFHK